MKNCRSVRIYSVLNRSNRDTTVYYRLIFCAFSWPNMVKWHHSGIIKHFKGAHDTTLPHENVCVARRLWKEIWVFLRRNLLSSTIFSLSRLSFHVLTARLARRKAIVFQSSFHFFFEWCNISLPLCFFFFDQKSGQSLFYLQRTISTFFTGNCQSKVKCTWYTWHVLNSESTCNYSWKYYWPILSFTNVPEQFFNCTLISLTQPANFQTLS